MLTIEQVERFRRDGFLKGSRVLSDAEIETLQAETLRVIEDRDDPAKPQPVMCHLMGGNIWQIVNIWQASPAFRDLISNPTIVEEMLQLTRAKTLRLWHDQIQFKPASTGGVNHWHQDGPYWPILQPKSQVTAWVALDDVDEGNGCMRMVPGSHLWGDHVKFLEALPSFDEMPSTFEGHQVKVVTCPVKKGEVHYHHALTWHGSGSNASGRPRRAIALHYMTEQTKYYASGEHVMKPFVTADDGQELAGSHFPTVKDS
ncbi:MAG TPA: phytanoyl-CoA dioxygenase family protein [Fimbriimonas sp.]|nr:phytanoyl-CoA dioxygenase family protein [Fimbriimonas sp.]